MKSNKLAPYILSILFFTSLGFGQFHVYAGFAIKPYMVVALMILLYVLFKRRIRFIKLSLFEYLFIIFLLVVGFSVIISQYPDQTLRFTANVILLLIVYFTLRTFFTSFINFERIKQAITKSALFVGLGNLGYYFMGIVSSGFSLSGNNIVHQGLMLDRDSPRLIGTASSDPNITAAFLSFFFLFLLLQKGHLFTKILLFAGIILTFSRGAYIAIAVALLLYFIFTYRRTLKKNLVKTFIGVTAIAGITLYILSATLNFSIIDMATGRFEDATLDNGSGRTTLWENAVTTFQDFPLFGIGANASLEYNTEHYNNPHYVHNTYLEVLSELGITGFFIYIAGIALALRTAYQACRYNSSYAFLIYLAIIAQMFFLSMMTSELYMLGILMIFLCQQEALKLYRKSSEAKQHANL